MDSRRSSTPKLVLAAILAPALGLALAACSSSGNTNAKGSTSGTSAAAAGGTSSSTAKPKRGGSLTVLEDKVKAGNWTSGLDPATGNIGYDTELQAIYGGLFQLRANDDGSNAHVVPNQAQSVKLSPDLKTLTIKIRPGIKFSDGTAFNAQALIWNFTRDFNSKCGCEPLWTLRKTKPFTSSGPLTVQIHLGSPDASIIDDFPYANTNWIASPTAYKKMGEKKFLVKPVGAGPFVVVSDELAAKLVLKRNPTFFKANQGLPYLDTLTFQAIGGGDQAAYQALLAGNADAYEGMTSPQLIKQAQAGSKIIATIQPSSQPDTVQMNTRKPPFNNKKAREALYYATNWAPINKGLFNDEGVITESFTTPIDLFYHKTVPGYRTYDLAKAKQLVHSLGGLSFSMSAGNTPAYTGVMKALQTEWEHAGMHVKILPEELALELKQYRTNDWQSSLVHGGSWDPATGLGLGLRFASNSPYSGTSDPKLDKLLQQGKTSANTATRDQTYQEIAKYLSDNAYAVFGLAVPSANVVVKGVHGPGLTTKIPGGLNLIPIWTETWKG